MPIHKLPEPLVEVLLRLSVAEVVDEDNALGVVVEDVAGVSVGMKPAHVHKFCIV